MKIDAIIFDMDGTLWDARDAVADSWNEALELLGESIRLSSKDIESVMGLPMDELSCRLFPRENPERQKKLSEACMAHEIEYLSKHPGKLYEGEIEALKELKEEGYPLAIVSNAQKGYIENYLNYFGLNDIYADHSSWGDNELPKYRNISIVKERNGWKDAVYVGDTGWDEDSAKKSGCRFLFASYGFGAAKEPDGVLKSFKDIRNAIKTLAK